MSLVLDLLRGSLRIDLIPSWIGTYVVTSFLMA
uniref:Uncharacterized protein n=1 Tax=Rhizophora mucronata TaxID=61149 RepID=A0A2P2NMV6_RHIMU